MVLSVILTMVFANKTQASAATGISSTIGNPDDEEVVSEETMDLIEELYSERRVLANDYEENRSEIEALDKKIEQLGVVTLSDGEIEEKSRLLAKTRGGTENLQRVKVSSAKDTKWTSVRQYTMYNGKEYELQIIRGVPTSGKSTLSCKDESYSKSSSGFVAGSKNVLKLAITNAISATGVIASSAITFYQAYQAFISGLKPTSKIEEAVECRYTTSYTVDDVYIYVKYRGALDKDQVICYMGDIVGAETAVVTPTGVNIDGRYVAKVDSKTYAYTVKSEGFDSASSYACEAFYNYNRKYNYHYLYNMGRFTLKAIGENISIRVPRADLNTN